MGFFSIFKKKKKVCMTCAAPIKKPKKVVKKVVKKPAKKKGKK